MERHDDPPVEWLDDVAADHRSPTLGRWRVDPRTGEPFTPSCRRATHRRCGRSSLRDLDELRRTVRSAGLEVLSTRTRMGTARFDSIGEFVTVEVESTPVRERLTDGEYDALRQEAHDVLAEFTAPNGTAEIPIEGHLVAARPR